MQLKRVQHWHSRLSNYLQEIEYTPFAFGRHDCSLFAAGAVLAMTDHDLAAAYRGTYDSARGAAKALREHGAGTLQATITASLGEPIHIAYAHRGDVVSHDGSIGICVGLYSLFVGTIDGTGNPDQTAQISFEQAEAGDLPEDEAEPEIPKGTGKTLIKIPTQKCDHAWRVSY